MKAAPLIGFCLTILIVAPLGCTAPSKDAGKATAEPPIAATPEPPKMPPPLTLTAQQVPTLPAIDGDASDVAWKDAPALKAGILSMKAVYTADELAILMTWQDRDLSINGRGTGNWTPETGTWWATGSKVPWESFKGKRHPEWLNLSFDISSKMQDEGCNAFCHENPLGSGKWHHNTAHKGEYVDSWTLLAKHGFGPHYLEDMGWLLGADGVTQSGTLVFDASDKLDPHQLLSGSLTFVGHAEDKVITSLDDPNYPKTNRPADQYCIKCHNELKAIDWTKTDNRTYGDDGGINHSSNWNDLHTAPLYIETAPKDFADCMVLTQAEIDQGEAVAVKDLGQAPLDKYWANYKALNGVVPQLVLKTPTGSQADVRVAANWTDGVWTLELERKLKTGYADDVQFSDLAKDYYFGISLWNHSDLLSPMFRTQGAALKFKK